MKMKRDGFSFLITLIVCITGFTLLTSASFAMAEEPKKDLPARGISVAPDYTGLIVPKGESVSLDLNVTNLGRAEEDIDLKITSIPKGWKARISTYSFDISGVHLASDKTKNLTLKLEPDEGTGIGKYPFEIKAQTKDGKFTSTGEVVVTVKEAEKDTKFRGVNIVTSYPVLQGPTDAKFEFSIEVENKTDKESIFNVASQGPTDWQINFKPPYEEKYISSLRLKSGQSQNMAVEVKPNPMAEAGKYPIQVKIQSPEGKAEVELTVVLTGTYKMEAGTPNGLLSLNAMRGKSANLSVYVKNTGSATQNNVRFLSFKPENWKVEFKPEKLENLAPNDLKQVEVVITPADQALVGDYSVGVSIEGEKVSKTLELRVTVKASTAWGWIGIGIIVFVLAGLVFLFVRMGRR